MNSLRKLDQSESNPKKSAWLLVCTLFFWLLIAAISKLAYLPPTPVASAVSNDVFSAIRAEAFLRTLVGDGIAHPAGSRQNKIVGDRLKTLMESFGYEVHEQFFQRKIRHRRNVDDPGELSLRNLYSVKAGTNDLGSVMIVAHYDSVPYGPGASDDGVAVAAILEIARMATAALLPGREVIFLFTDGEEYGLLGADAFVQENQIAERVDFVINLEARGTSGCSLMFQTSCDSQQLITLFAKSVERPVTSSIFEEVYKRLPNDTDFTVFRDDAQMRGFNFAFIGDARNYHTSEDNFEKFDRGSLQHHGENAWGLLRTLASQPDLPVSNDQSVYFDLFGRTIVHWNSKYSVPLSVAFVICQLIWLWTSISRKKLKIKELGMAVAAILTTLFFVVCSSLFLEYSFRLQNRFSPPWVDYPELISISYWSVAIFVSVFTASYFRLNETAVWFAVWLVWGLFGLAASVYVTGASFLFAVPLALAIVSRFSLFGLAPWAFLLTGSVAAAIIWLPIGVLFYDALGFSMIAVLLFRIVFMITTLLPIVAYCEKKSCVRLGWVVFSLSLIAVLASVLMNPVN